MNNISLFDKNIHSLRKNNKILADKLNGLSESSLYRSVSVSQSGIPVPVLANGSPINSMYNPKKEAAKLLSDIQNSCFVFFMGIGSGCHIKLFLETYPESRCIVFEKNVSDFVSLIRLIDLSSIFEEKRVSLIFQDDVDRPDFLSQYYYPALDGNFIVLYLRPWKDYHKDCLSIIEDKITKSLHLISADYSVQAHFGRIWQKNIIRNLSIASKCKITIPNPDLSKKAIVAAAGPTLERSLDELSSKRSEYVIFSTDTAYPVLVHSGITPEYLISIDAQLVSASHIFCGLLPETTVVLDICGNPAIAEKAQDAGCPLIIASSGHPLGIFATRFSQLPLLNTRGGTVTFSAMDVAYSLGYSSVQLIGADFCYRCGKPYARGTYFEGQLLLDSTRLKTAETFWGSLIFRSPVTKKQDSMQKISYHTELLDRYSAYCRSFYSDQRWRHEDFSVFPMQRFLVSYSTELKRCQSSDWKFSNFPVFLYPLLAWFRTKFGGDDIHQMQRNVINLALKLIAGYTEVL